MSAHTPGPWRASPPNDDKGNIITVGPDGDYLCIIGPCDRGSGEAFIDEDYANARLIAAAPDLYEALKDARRLLDENDLPIVCRQIDAALAKCSP